MERPKSCVWDALRGEKEPLVVVVRPGALGDTLLTLPTFSYLKALRPDAKMFFCGSHWAAKVQPMTEDLYSFIPFDSGETAPLFSPAPPGHFPAPFSNAHLAIVYTKDTQSCFARNVRALSKGTTIVWDSTPPAPPAHFAAHLANAVTEKKVTSPQQLPSPRIRASGTEIEAVRQRFLPADGRPIAVIHPGSGSPAKNAGPEYFIKTIDRLQKRNFHCVLIEGPADSDACRRVVERMGKRAGLVTARGLRLAQTAALLQISSFFIGNDSGLSHLSALLGVKTHVLFKTTDPRIWAPTGPDVIIHRPHGAAETAGAFLQALRFRTSLTN